MTFAIEYVSKVHLFWMICFLILFVNTVKTNILVVHLPKARCKGIFIKKKIITVEYVNGTEYHLIQRMIK